MFIVYLDTRPKTSFITSVMIVDDNANAHVEFKQSLVDVRLCDMQGDIREASVKHRQNWI